jgi:alpha-ketoglutarate-dependent taurine dioxygenase
MANLNKANLLPWALEIADFNSRSPAAITELTGLMHEHPLIVVRDQHLDKDQFLAFMNQVGLPVVQRFTRSHVVELSARSKTNLSSTSELGWHADESYRTDCPEFLCLYGANIPAEAGKTYWANTALAFERLSSRLKEEIRDLHALHEFSHFDHYLEGLVEFENEKSKKTGYAFGKEKFPVLGEWRGTKFLRINHGFTSKILDADSSLLNVLLKHIEDPAHQYAHEWRRGDLVLANNHLLIHRRDRFADTSRLLFRGLINLG